MRDTDANDPGHSHVVQMFDSFEIMGPNGKHVCMVFEVALTWNISSNSYI